MKIICSPLSMYANLPAPFITSIMNRDRTINLEKLIKILDDAASQGATALRDFYWPLGNEHLAPFNQRTLEFNNLFFENQRTIAIACNNRGLRYIYCLFNHCETKQKDQYSVSVYSPWARFKDFFYGPDAKEQREKYIKRVIETFQGLDVGLDQCNEVGHNSLDFLVHSFLCIEKSGFPMNKVILGIDYYLKEMGGYTGLYKKFKNAIMAELGEEWGEKLKTVCWSTIHGCTLPKIKEFLEDTRQNGLRNIIFSYDGTKYKDGDSFVRPDRQEAFELATFVKSKKGIDIVQGQISFEAVYGKHEKDPLDTAVGFRDALEGEEMNTEIEKLRANVKELSDMVATLCKNMGNIVSRIEELEK